MFDFPTVTVVIPTFNRKSELARALASVGAQTLRPSQVIVVDDCSTDGTEALVKQQFPSVQYMRLPEKANASVARNLGIARAFGEYVAFLDSDDLWESEHLEVATEALESRPELGGVVCSIILERPSGARSKRVFEERELKDIANRVVKGDIDTRSSSLVLRRAVAADTEFDPLLGKHQDWDFAIRCAKKWKLAALPSATVILSLAGNSRMSASPNFTASKRFLAKHRGDLGRDARSCFDLSLAQAAFLHEGRTDRFWRYWWRSVNVSNIKSAKKLIKIMLMIAPGGTRGFRVLKR